jgi:LPXTG-motif cell wall-anchored protein
MKRFYLSLFLTGAMGVSLAPGLKADPVYKRTEVTFHQPVEIPGMVLAPGTYVMKLLDPYMDRDIVRFYDPQEKHMYAMVFAVRDYRLNAPERTVITFEERAANAPQALKEWIPAGENWGEEFVYPKARPVAAAVAQVTTPPAPIQAQPAPAAVAPSPAPPVAEVPPLAQVPPEQPVEVAPAQPSPAPSEQAAPAPESNLASEPQQQELPKTASNLPLAALLGGVLTLAGAILRRRTA